MSAPAQNDRPIPIDSEVAQHSLGEGRIDVDSFRIVLDAANDMDAVWEHANGRPAIDILRLWHADQIEKPEGRGDKKLKPAKSLFGSRGQARVDQRERDSARVRFDREIRPNFRFDQNDLRRPNQPEVAPHDRPEIKRRVEYFDPTRSALACKRKPSRRGRSKNKPRIRSKRPDRLREFERNHDFAHTDRVQPGRFLRGEPRAKIDIVNSEPLSELMPVIAAPEHLHQIARQEKQQAERPKQIVKKTNHFPAGVIRRTDGACRKNKTSVAP